MKISDLEISEENITAENLIKKIRNGELGDVVNVVFILKGQTGKFSMKLVDATVADKNFISFLSKP